MTEEEKNFHTECNILEQKYQHALNTVFNMNQANDELNQKLDDVHTILKKVEGDLWCDLSSNMPSAMKSIRNAIKIIERGE